MSGTRLRTTRAVRRTRGTGVTRLAATRLQVETWLILPGNNANYYPNHYSGEDPNGNRSFPIDSPYYTTVVGEFQNSASPYGTFDQGGNVWEWTETIGVPGFHAFVSRRAGRFVRRLRLRLSPSRVDARHLRLSHRAGTLGSGFRVSEVPEPATIVMLALAGVGILRRKGA